MNNIDWLTVVPSAMSAIAAVAAAYAAFVALRVSRKANYLSEKSILAAHHSDAACVLSSSIDRLKKETKDLSECSYRLWVDWSREIESKDDRRNGGSNPRPLRHVLTNGSEMLVAHGTLNGKRYRHAQRSMFSIVRDGVSGLDGNEYNGLLQKADGTYGDFESTFGLPPINRKIGEAKAFRWVLYQLARRVNHNDWLEIWKRAWLDDGWIVKYRREFSKVKPVLEEVHDSLKVEKKKVTYSVIPLESNAMLHRKYEMLLSEVEILLDDCSLDSLEIYRDWEYAEDVSQLVLYSMGVANLVGKILDSIYSGSDLDR
ncbi:hypothetical protein [Aquisalimonas asiatica]|uniref:Uncharacterized protein n=1 Tax=Aquisalimonas asiatica TaxID=406100 RepID=A0A1H8PZM3_9GAMM|nr:hypothetical protein [Aquisalimonas asiatica]SEO46983.1 hypothetical protein SAMN04488052_101236 [Aquisalimonas asiatica]